MDKLDRQSVEEQFSGELENPFDEELECSECGHALYLHEDQYGCDYEKDVPDPDIGWVALRCGCAAHGPLKREADMRKAKREVERALFVNGGLRNFLTLRRT